MTGWGPILAQAAADLRQAGVPDPMRDARLLLAHALGIAPERVTLHLGDAPGVADVQRFHDLTNLRGQRHPLSHLTGQRLFWGRSFRVTPDVLDPRPETETLIELALGQNFDTVLDLGTGSGAILVSLLADRPMACGTGSDVSQAALTVARLNADAL
ncbi:MAG: HemK/PrmC family methyltransferase, partial [Gemmobacter sp.]|nr:HemK/PrmC family methyltransferase [Gemmobacter sp.]